MISGGNATIIVRSMDDSIRFYRDVLGLELTSRFGDDWATIDAGVGLTLGIHPVSPDYPEPGTRGSVVLGFDIDVSVEQAVETLARHGIATGRGIVRGEAGSFIHIDDPDGNQIYLWEKTPEMRVAAKSTMAAASMDRSAPPS